jgi:hypothetical protein
MRSVVAVVLGLVPLLLGPNCGKSLEGKVRGEPCTRTQDCAGSLHCIGGVCDVAGDGGQDAGPDAAGGTPDGGNLSRDARVDGTVDAS